MDTGPALELPNCLSEEIRLEVNPLVMFQFQACHVRSFVLDSSGNHRNLQVSSVRKLLILFLGLRRIVALTDYESTALPTAPGRALFYGAERRTARQSFHRFDIDCPVR